MARQLSEQTRKDLGIVFRRARNNNSPPKKILNDLFGLRFSKAFRYSLEVLRETGDKRESGHASIVHSLEVALGLLGYANSYGPGHERDGEIIPVRPIVTPYDLIGMKTEEYLIEAVCTASLHDAVEDSSKSAGEIERGLEKLEQALSQFGKRFARRVTRNVELLTNKYARLLKGARKSMRDNGEPVDSVRAGLESNYDELSRNHFSEYAELIKKLLVDLENLVGMRDKIDKRFHASYFAHLSSIDNIVDYLSYRAYNHFTRDLLHACIGDFQSWADGSDIPLLVKRQDGVNNVETVNLSIRRKIRRSLAKAEMVARRLNSEEHGIEEGDIAREPDESLGWLQFLKSRGDIDTDYFETWEALATELRDLIIRACIIRRTVLEGMDVHSMAGEMGPYLEALERKYRAKYGIPERDGQILVVRENPVGDLWKRDRSSIDTRASADL